MTVGRLHKLLTALIEKGDSRRLVCVWKETFSSNLEPDQAIFDVHEAIPKAVLQLDDDGGTKVNSRGQECTQRCLVLVGDGYEPDASLTPPAAGESKGSGQ